MFYGAHLDQSVDDKNWLLIPVILINLFFYFTNKRLPQKSYRIILKDKGL